MFAALFVPLLLPLAAAPLAPPPPEPVGPVPSPRQLAWHELEYYGFLHFTMNTFTGKEWGYGDESPELFDPTDLDVRQWTRVAREAGMRGLILTAKHHDGFCLWPSQYTEHTLARSPYRDGQGDIVGSLAEACREEGLAFGVYLSPWDRNHADYGGPAYIDYFRNQLEELLTEYGPVFEVWFDGANGGDGYYGGARETRHIDRTHYYGWPETWSLVRQWQPGAVLFSDVGPDIRWVGNERGYAGDPCWATYTPRAREAGETPAPGATEYQRAQEGDADGAYWMPAEVDVSIRPGWFYHERENDRVRSPENLLEIYYESVGRGANLLLNVPPDPRGLIHERDVASLRGLRELLDGIFDVDLAQQATPSASHVRGGSEVFGPAHLTDGEWRTYWTTDDDVTQAEVALRFDAPIQLDHIVLQEYIPLGQRIRAYRIEALTGTDEWRVVAEGQSIGWKRIHRIEPVATSAVRVVVEDAIACPALATFALHASPETEALE